MSMVTPALPVDVYRIIVKRKKPTHSVEYVLYMQSKWHHKITILFHTFGVKYIRWGEVYIYFFYSLYLY